MAEIEIKVKLLEDIKLNELANKIELKYKPALYRKRARTLIYENVPKGIYCKWTISNDRYLRYRERTKFPLTTPMPKYILVKKKMIFSMLASIGAIHRGFYNRIARKYYQLFLKRT